MPPQREWFEKDYYAVLGLTKDASEKEITRAYRKLAKQHHPDANAGNKEAEERFKEVSAAYDVLGDPAKRKEYDEVRRMAASGFGGTTFGPGFGAGGAGGPNGGFGDFGDGSGGFRFETGGDAGGLGDLLGNLFGGRNRRGGTQTAGRAGPRRGGDLEAEIHLSFDDAVHGATIGVQLTGAAPCSQCGGTGAAPGTLPQTCPQCGGAGTQAVDQGPFSFSQVCSRCGGNGRIVETPCPRCGGGGAETRSREVKVRIPVGVADGQRVRVKGKGTPGRNGGPPGDLYVNVHVAPHPIFGRRGDHLLLRVPVTFSEAALGAEVRVPTLTNPVTVRIPPGTPHGKTLRVRGRGMPKASGGAGDLLVTVEVVVPQNLSDEQRHAVEALAAADTGNPRTHLGV
ncbi:MAG TPA: molecular chaperone DnaJ [Acidimicrobiia bacterium]|nr:molecular chaperone DnaJ [Acidimicrobiia bacterium]